MRKINLSIKNVSASPIFTALGAILAIAIPILSTDINTITLAASALVFTIGCFTGVKK